jgi:hypothetical protein
MSQNTGIFLMEAAKFFETVGRPVKVKVKFSRYRPK